jgi:hypothetical protein
MLYQASRQPRGRRYGPENPPSAPHRPVFITPTFHQLNWSSYSCKSVTGSPDLSRQRMAICFRRHRTTKSREIWDVDPAR